MLSEDLKWLDSLAFKWNLAKTPIEMTLINTNAKGFVNEVGIIYYAKVYYDKQQKEYKIEYVEHSDKAYNLAHELGHIQLSERCKYPLLLANTKIDSPINSYINVFEDIFVDYFCIKDFNLKRLYSERLNNLLETYKESINQASMKSFLSYLFFYMTYKFVFDNSDKQNLKFLPRLFDNFEKTIISQANSPFKSVESFNTIKKELDTFEAIKDTNDYKVILDYMYNILETIGFWTETELKEYFLKSFNYKL